MLHKATSVLDSFCPFQVFEKLLFQEAFLEVSKDHDGTTLAIHWIEFKRRVLFDQAVAHFERVNRSEGRAAT